MTDETGADDLAGAACRYWDPAGCAGTAHCPPRCPRFVDEFGSAVVIQPAGSADGPAVEAFFRACDGGLASDEFGGEARRFVATDGDAIVGHATLVPDGDDLVLSTWVAPDRRAGGLREELVRQAVAHAAANGWGDRVVGDDADPGARRRYGRLGFDVDGGRAVLSLDGAVAAQVQLAPGVGGASAGTAGTTHAAPGNDATPALPDRPFERLFAPARVAVVGATERPGAIGNVVTTNLLASFAGEVVPINPTADRVHGRLAYPDVRAVPDPVDLAVVVRPADDALEALRGVGQAGIPAAVVVSAGFWEAGEAGARRERELRRIAAAYDLTVVGPNSMGVMATGCGLNASFAPEAPRPGPISLVSQSGSLITAILARAADHDVGFEHVVSLGNAAVVDEADLLAYWDDDPAVEVIAAYLEGVDDGRAFVEAASAADTPVVVLKSGRTGAGARAAASHTGSMAGGSAAFDAACERAGIVRVETVEELFDAARALTVLSPPDPDAVGIVTNAGGPGVLAADALAAADLDLASFSSATARTLRETVPDAGSAVNPVDVLGDADVGRIQRALDAVLADDGVGVGLVLTAPHPLVETADLAAAVGELADRHGKPVVTAFLGEDLDPETRATLRERGVVNYAEPARAARGLAALVASGADRETAGPQVTFEVDRERAEDLLVAARREGRTSLGVEAMALLDAYGIPTPAGELVESPAAAEAAARRLGGDVVMKVASPDVQHKSDVGGVEIGVAVEDAADTYEELLASVGKARPDATLLGVYVQERVDSDGVETIVGLSRDPQFGPVLAFGLGGVFVEALDDAAFEVAPVTDEAAEAMVAKTTAGTLLGGVRGQPAGDVGAVVDTLQRLSRLAADFPAIRELDVNPLVVAPGGVVALDLQVELADR